MIGVTGASSGIGRAVLTAADQAGVEVAILGRSSPGARHYDITAPLREDSLAGLSAVIHLAWSWDGAPGTNASASGELAAACRRQAVRPVLLSTFSVFAAAKSRYGAEKAAAERAFVDAGGMALRAGLIWGAEPAGMVRTLSKLALMPLVAPRLAPDPSMRHSHEVELADWLVRAARGGVPEGTYLAASRETVALSLLLARLRGSRTGLTVPVPVPVLGWVAVLAERLRVPLPFRADSIAALDRRADLSVSQTEIPWLDGFADNEAFLSWAAAAAG